MTDSRKPAGRSIGYTDMQARARKLQAGATHIARKGEWVTCEGGHRICQIAKDMENKAPHLDPSYFENWRIDANTALVTLKCSCGKVWGDSGSSEETADDHLHFGGGWR